VLRQATRFLGGTAALAAGGWVLRAAHDAPAALGAAQEVIAAVAQGSPNFRDGVFVNREPASGISLNREEQTMLLRDLFLGRTTGRPAGTIPLTVPDLSGAAADIAATWFGHSSVLIEVDGYRVLADPVWSGRCSPSHTVGPQRMHPVPAELDVLPALDAVIISHDHYDHLDMATITTLAQTQTCKFVVPLGVGAHLRSWGVPAERVVELDWDAEAVLGELRLVCTPARHFSGRFLTRNTTLWSSWAILGPRHRAFFGGDTGYTRDFAGIGAEHGPFDLTLLPIGAYHPGWPDIHMNPEEAVRAHRDVTDTGLLVPIHWATFRLAPHPWPEPVERMLVAAQADGVAVAVPAPGGRVDADAPAGPLVPWFRL
jgi:L-ascorbate metabolism protein UlaG (beta-lactamase superfamily)